MTMPRIVVVVPFYQREPGILARAVRSALDQTGVDHLQVLVVDDSSPVPAPEELGALLAAEAGRVCVIRRPNGGPGAARNTALNTLRADTEYVAFLDSDDVWAPNHLSQAVSALDQGYDFYFADFLQLGQSTSAFQRRGHIDPLAHRPLPQGSELHEYAGDIFAQTLTRNVIGTSTVVYRRSACPDLRFEEDYSHAGEDYLFWLDLFTRTRRVAFSARIECTYGKGVNVYAGSGWGSEGSLRRAHCEIKYLRAVPRRYRLSRSVASQVKQATRCLRRYFVAEMLHRLAHHKPLDLSLLRAQLRVDPWTGVFFVPLAVAIGLSAAKATLTGARVAVAGLISFLKDMT